MAAPRRFVALLRGVNVGGVRRVSMADLRAIVEGLGHTDVRTHLQSGNVVFTAVPGVGRADALARGISSALESALGFPVDVLVRSRAQLAAVVAHDPLAAVATDRSKYLVVFLSAAPPAGALAAIDAAAYAPEKFSVRGSELYLWAPDGVHKAKLPKAFGSFGGVATARNWNTVTRLLELLDE